MSARRRPFNHVLLIMFENQYREYVMENAYFRGLATRGIELGGMHGVFHPSQTNYIASVAGELCNVSSDERYELDQPTIVDLLENAGVSWKAYMDGYDPEFAPWDSSVVPQDQYPYVLKHNPFFSFTSIIRSESRWQRVVGEGELWRDLRRGTLPAYCWFSPDMWNDGHWIRGTEEEPKDRIDLIAQAADWLEWFFKTLGFPGPESLLPPRTLVIVTFDEADFEADWTADVYDGPNQIYTVLLGDTVGTALEMECYNHYSILRTVEENFGLGTLGKNDADSNWLRFLWDERFSWSEPQPTPVPSNGAVGAAALGDRLLVVREGGSGALESHQWDGTRWTDAGSLPFEGTGPVVTAYDGGTILLYRTPRGALVCRARSREGAWGEAEILGEAGVEAFAATACARGRDVMVVFRDAEDVVWSRRNREGVWEPAVDTGHKTDGALAVAALGHTVFLLHRVPGGALDMASYNTADFNVVTCEGVEDAPQESFTRDTWSPGTWPVGHFTAASTPTTPGEREPRLDPYTAGRPFSAAELDGVIHLVHPAPGGGPLLTETFSLSGILTPEKPVVYRGGASAGTSNGYGTLAEAGWNEQETIAGIRAAEDGVLTLCRFQDSVVMLVQEVSDGGELQLLFGRYRADAAAPE